MRGDVKISSFLAQVRNWAGWFIELASRVASVKSGTPIDLARVSHILPLVRNARPGQTDV